MLSVHIRIGKLKLKVAIQPSATRLNYTADLAVVPSSPEPLLSVFSRLPA